MRHCTLRYAALRYGMLENAHQSATATTKPTEARLAGQGQARPRRLSVGAKYVLGPAIHACTALMTSRRRSAVAARASSLLPYSAELSTRSGSATHGDATASAVAATAAATAWYCYPRLCRRHQELLTAGYDKRRRRSASLSPRAAPLFSSPSQDGKC